MFIAHNKILEVLKEISRNQKSLMLPANFSGICVFSVLLLRNYKAKLVAIYFKFLNIHVRSGVFFLSLIFSARACVTIGKAIVASQ